MMALMIVNVDGLKLGGQLDRETTLVTFRYIVYFVHCAFSMLSENKFYLLTLTMSVIKACMRYENALSSALCYSLFNCVGGFVIIIISDLVTLSPCLTLQI